MAFQLIGVMDPRTGLEVLRRPHLREILLSKGKDVPPNTIAEKMRQTISGENIDLRPFILKTVHGNWIPNEAVIGALRSKRLKRGEVKEVKPEVPSTITISEPSPPVDDIDDLKMPQLRQLAKKLGIKQSNTDKAADLIGKIKEHGNTP